MPAGDKESEGIGLFKVGQRADFIVFEARKYDELLSRPQSDRVVVRSGCAISTKLPSYSELDGLVGELTELKLDSGLGVDQLKRGATVVDGA